MPHHLESLGRRLQQFRGRLYTQQELADKAGVSRDVVKKTEQNRHTPSVASLHALAHALDVTLADLLGPARLPEQPDDEGAVALRHAVTGIDELIGPPEGTPPADPQTALRHEIYAWGVYWSGDHDKCAAVLPPLLLELRAGYAAANTADRPTVAYALSRVLWAAGSTLMHLKHVDAAHAATRWAVQLARETDDAAMHATVSGSLAWQFMVGGRYRESLALSLQSAHAIEPSGAVSAPHLSAYGSLLLQSGNAAARAGQAGTAEDYLQQARDVSDRIGEERNDYSTTFGPSLIAMQSADIHLCLGEYDRATRAAATMPADAAALPKMARCRHLADRAFAHTRLGQADLAVPLVSTAVSLSPNWGKHQQLPKTVVGELLRTSRRRDQRLRSLATSLGVTA